MQVEEAMFEVTKTALKQQKSLGEYHDRILDAFGIEWNTVVWEDLRKAQHCSLAAHLYLMTTSGFEDMPRDIDGQALYWEDYYRPGGDVAHFKEEANRLEEGDYVCLFPSL